MSELDFRTGRWASAYAAGAEAARLGEETGQLNDMAYALCVLSRVEAALGREQDCRANLAHALELVERLGAESLRAHVGTTLGFLELGLGRAEEAAVALEAVERFLGDRPANDPAVLQWAPDLIEAYVRHGRRADAAAALAAFEQDAAHSGSRWAAATAARCRGLLAGEEAFEGESGARWPCTRPRSRPAGRSWRWASAYGARAAAWRHARACARRWRCSTGSARGRGPSGRGRSCARRASASGAAHPRRPSG